MPRTFLALTIAALASFATAAHADDGATARSTTALSHAEQSRGHLVVALVAPDLLRPPHGQVILADLVGKGVLGQPCNASAVNSQGGTDHIYIGKYVEIFGKLRCQSGTGESIDCRKDDKSWPPKNTCKDGHAQP
jgi:hypothetical protein